MKVIISYSFKDKALLKQVERTIKTDCRDFISTSFIFKKKHRFNWKKQVSDKIKKSSIFICILSKNSLKSENQRWEISEAKELNKTIVYVISEFIDLSDFITPDYKVEIGELYDILADIFKYSENAINDILFTKNEKTILDQYKLMVDSDLSPINRTTG